MAPTFQSQVSSVMNGESDSTQGRKALFGFVLPWILLFKINFMLLYFTFFKLKFS